MTKGLHICRHLHKAGWRVVLVDYDRWWMQGSRLSSCCAAFHTVPDPEQNPIGDTCYGLLVATILCSFVLVLYPRLPHMRLDDNDTVHAF